jgi:hypothetical protein
MRSRAIDKLMLLALSSSDARGSDVVAASVRSSSGATSGLENLMNTT